MLIFDKILFSIKKKILASLNKGKPSSFQKALEIKNNLKLVHAKLPCQKPMLGQIECIQSTYHKERSFSSNHFLFLGILLQFMNLL